MTLQDLKTIEKALLDYAWFHENFKAGDLRESSKALQAMVAIQDIIRTLDQHESCRVEIRRPLQLCE